MKCRSRWFRFDLPDERWEAAGMVGFVTSRTAYRRNAVRRTMILRIDEIAVPPRGAGVPDFERDRMVSVLDAIRHDRTLPPIEVVEAISNLYGHRLYHGRHRLAASIAVGFSLVPAVIVRDLDEIKRAEAMAPC
jgi:ParB-like chromosome segregation protein Spo0J